MNNITKAQWEKILSVLLGATLAIFAILGWVIRPEYPGGVEPAPTAVFGAQALAGDVTNFAGLELDLSSSTNAALDVDQTGTGNVAIFRDGGSAVLTIADGGNMAMTGQLSNSTGVLTITTNTRFSGAYPVLGEASVLAVGADGIITPTSSYQPITSTAEVTASATTAIADGAVNGQLLCLVNENASDVIHVPDAANTNLSGQADLGNDDILCVFWDGADWLQFVKVDN